MVVMDGTVSGEDRRARRKPAGPAVRPNLVEPLDPPQHFYRTAATPCPYVPGRIERKLVTELAGREALPLYNELSRGGFRRSHNLAYRPACVGCQGCVPVRIAVREFAPTRSLRRVARHNRDLVARIAEPSANFEQYRIFARYQRSRHDDSEMASMTFGDFRGMIEDSPVSTRLVELRGGLGELLGVCLVDLLDDGLSAVYSFYEPDDRRRSLGTYLILALIEEAKRRGLPYVYLGYWIAESPKMAYKARFQPLEGLGRDGWERITPPRVAPSV
jgi:leucyl-tRNA---protein transferase